MVCLALNDYRTVESPTHEPLHGLRQLRILLSHLEVILKAGAAQRGRAQPAWESRYYCPGPVHECLELSASVACAQVCRLKVLLAQ